MGLLGSCLFLAYLIPFHVSPFTAFYNEWLAIFGVALVTLMMAMDKNAVLHLPWVSLIPFGLAGFVGLQVLMGSLSTPADAAIPVAYLIFAGLAIVLGASIRAADVGAGRLYSAIAAAHLFAAIASVVIASLQFYAAEGAFAPFFMRMAHVSGKSIRPFANIGQPNQLALLMLIGIASVWWMYQAKNLKANIALVVSLALVWGLALTQSRVGWLVVPLFALAIPAIQRDSRFRKIPRRVLAGLVLIYLVLIIGLPFLAEAFGSTTLSALQRVSGNSIRLVQFTQALHISLQHPWLGAGWYDFGPE